MPFSGNYEDQRYRSIMDVLGTDQEPPSPPGEDAWLSEVSRRASPFQPRFGQERAWTGRAELPSAKPFDAPAAAAGFQRYAGGMTPGEAVGHLAELGNLPFNALDKLAQPITEQALKAVGPDSPLAPDVALATTPSTWLMAAPLAMAGAGKKFNRLKSIMQSAERTKKAKAEAEAAAKAAFTVRTSPAEKVLSEMETLRAQQLRRHNIVGAALRDKRTGKVYDTGWSHIIPDELAGKVDANDFEPLFKFKDGSYINRDTAQELLGFRTSEEIGLRNSPLTREVAAGPKPSVPEDALARFRNFEGRAPRDDAELAAWWESRGSKLMTKGGTYRPQSALDPEQAKELLTQGGFSFDVGENRFLTPKKDKGVMVGIAPRLRKTLEAGYMDEDLADALAAIEKEAWKAKQTDPRISGVGGWVSPENNLVLDVVGRAPDVKTGTEWGKAVGEQSLFDLGRVKEVPLSSSYDDLLAADQAAATRLREATRGGKRIPMKKLSETFASAGIRPSTEAALEGVHLQPARPAKTGSVKQGAYSGSPPLVQDQFDLDLLRQGRYQTTLEGAPYAGWYFEEGALPPGPIVPQGGALWRTNPQSPDPTRYAIFSPLASPGVDLIRDVHMGAGLERGKTVNPMFGHQTKKAQANAAGKSVKLGPKEGAFASNLGTEAEFDPLSTIDRHEGRGAGWPITEGQTTKSGLPVNAHAFLHGENLIIDDMLKRALAENPNLLAEAGWPKNIPVVPNAEQAARWAVYKAQAEYPDLPLSEGIKRILENPENRVSTFAPLLAATERIPEGFDWRTPTGHDPMYLSPNLRQWPETTPSAPTRAHPLVASTAYEPKYAEGQVHSVSKDVIENRMRARNLAQGTPGSTWEWQGKERSVSVPISEGEGTGVRDVLARLSETEKANLGPEVFQALRQATPGSPAQQKTLDVLRQGGMRGLDEYVRKHGYKGLLGLVGGLGVNEALQQEAR